MTEGPYPKGKAQIARLEILQPAENCGPCPVQCYFSPSPKWPILCRVGS